MKIFRKDQKSKFGEYLIELMGKPTMKYSHQSLKEKITTIDLNTDKKLKELNLNFLFDYNIFPSNIMSFQTQWNIEQRNMRVGDTILQQVFVPPLKTFSQKIIFGVRVNSVIDEAERKGFSYETIEGHVEKGQSIFTVEHTSRGLIFKIHTFSVPGNFLTRLVGPIFSLPYQAFCTRMALRNVKSLVDFQS